jgi:hypothetical protein
MVGTCECGQVISNTAKNCLRCGGVNPNYKKPSVALMAVSACDVLWALLFIFTVIQSMLFPSMLKNAENIMQQIYACSNTLCWVVLGYVATRCLTMIFHK